MTAKHVPTSHPGCAQCSFVYQVGTHQKKKKMKETLSQHDFAGYIAKKVKLACPNSASKSVECLHAF